jgi:ABC-type multidrug transport system permease subunit
VTEAPPPRSALVELTLARFRLFFREPSALFWTFGFPVILSVALGIAFRTRPPEPVLVDVEAGPGASEIVSKLTFPGIRVRLREPEAARGDLRSGQTPLVVVPGMPVTYRYDETRPEARLARAAVDDRLQRAAGRTDPVAIADERVTDPGARYIDFLIPGLVGLNLMSSSMWGIGYLIVEMRTKKLVKRMLATPMRRADFLLSFVLMRAVFVLIEVPVLFAFGWIAFGVHIAGSWALLLAVSLLGALAFAGIGLLVASRAQNTQTVGGLMNLVMMPMFVGSGVFFATTRFPDAMQPYLRLLPLTAINDALRMVANQGGGVREISGAVTVLAAWGLVSFGVALRIFRWR